MTRDEAKLILTGLVTDLFAEMASDQTSPERAKVLKKYLEALKVVADVVTCGNCRRSSPEGEELWCNEMDLYVTADWFCAGGET